MFRWDHGSYDEPGAVPRDERQIQDVSFLCTRKPDRGPEGRLLFHQHMKVQGIHAGLGQWMVQGNIHRPLL